METKELTTKAQNYLHAAAHLSIKSNATFDAATAWLKDIKALGKEINSHYAKPIKAAHDAHKAILAAKKEQSEPLAKAECLLKEKLSNYHQRQERLRIAEEKRLSEIARKAEEDRRLDEAIDTGNDQVLDEPIVSPNVSIESQTKTDGVSYRSKWTFKIIDPALVPDNFKKIDEQAIGRVVRAMSGKIKIPGVQVIEEKVMSVRT
jgi:Tfp pilus assembly protein FimV